MYLLFPDLKHGNNKKLPFAGLHAQARHFLKPLPIPRSDPNKINPNPKAPKSESNSSKSHPGFLIGDPALEEDRGHVGEDAAEPAEHSDPEVSEIGERAPRAPLYP